MTDQEIVRMTNEVFADTFEVPAENLLPEKHMFNDLGLDSLDTVDLIVALQKKFGVQLRSDERVKSVRTLADLYKYIGVVMAEMKARAGGGH